MAQQGVSRWSGRHLLAPRPALWREEVTPECELFVLGREDLWMLHQVLVERGRARLGHAAYDKVRQACVPAMRHQGKAWIYGLYEAYTVERPWRARSTNGGRMGSVPMVNKHRHAPRVRRVLLRVAAARILLRKDISRRVEGAMIFNPVERNCIRV